MSQSFYWSDTVETSLANRQTNSDCRGQHWTITGTNLKAAWSLKNVHELKTVIITLNSTLLIITQKSTLLITSLHSTLLITRNSTLLIITLNSTLMIITKQYTTDHITTQYTADHNTKQYTTDHNTKQYTADHNTKPYTTDRNTKHIQYSVFPEMLMVAQLLNIFPSILWQLNNM